MFFNKAISVHPNNTGFLFKDNRLEKTLSPGIYEFPAWKNYKVISIPTITNIIDVTNQEVLTKDNISLRFSYVVEYAITNPNQFVEKFDIFETNFNAITKADQFVHNYSQLHIRSAIGQITSEDLNEKKGTILSEVPEKLHREMEKYGIEITNQFLKDITFPKSIQNLFSKKLEAKIRTNADLENARSTVATARALKNASALMQDDDNIKFIQLLETITKISNKGNHTFVLSDFLEKIKK